MSDNKLQITTSMICNNKCCFCVDDHLDVQMAEPDISCEKNIIKNLELNKGRTKEVLFTSGEPTLNNQLTQYIRLAKKLKYKKIALVTNARLLDNELLCKRLVAAGVNDISVSIHGSNEKIHDAITGVIGSFKQTLKGIANLIVEKRKRRMELNVNYTINKINYSDIHDFVRLIHFLPGIDRIIFNTVRPYGRARTNFERVVPRYSAIGREFKKAMDKYNASLKDSNLIINIIDLPPCILPGYEKYFGRLEKINIQNYLFNDAAEDNWYTEKVKREKCHRCKYDDFCPGVYDFYIAKRGWSEFKPIR